MTFQRVGLAAWATAALLLLAPGSASAEIPTGHFEIALFLNQSIWLDVTEGEDEFCEGFAEGFGGTLLACEFSMFLDAKGKITGAVEIQAENGEVFVGLEGPVKGKVKGDGQTGIADLGFSVKLSGYVFPLVSFGPTFGWANAQTLPLPGFNATNVSANVAFAGQIDGEGELTGEWTTKLCSKATGCISDMETPPTELLEGGGWTLVLEIDDLGSGKLGGSASAELGDGTQCPYSISGKYNAKTDVASLKLSPTNTACSGTSISLKDVRLAAFLTAQMKYKLFGYQGDTPVESVDR